MFETELNLSVQVELLMYRTAYTLIEQFLLWLTLAIVIFIALTLLLALLEHLQNRYLTSLISTASVAELPRDIASHLPSCDQA